MTTLYSDFLLDPDTGDLDVSNGLSLIISNQISLRQRLYLRFNTWQGAWYFDETFGFPHRSYIGKKVMKAVLDNKIKEVINEEPDVLSIENFSSSMDVSYRSYEASCTVYTTEGEEVELEFSGSKGYIYPEPSDETVTLCGE